MESTALARNPHLPSLSKSVEEKCDSIKLFSDSSDVESNIGSKKDDNFNHSCDAEMQSRQSKSEMDITDSEGENGLVEASSQNATACVLADGSEEDRSAAFFGSSFRDVFSFVISALRHVVPTEDSVHGCAAMFQSRYGNDPFLLEQCLKSLLAFFLTGDNKSRRHAFYVVNDLVQYDARFRLPALEILFPRIPWVAGSMEDFQVYTKTVAVWRERNIYPPHLCQVLETAFQSASVSRRNLSNQARRSLRCCVYCCARQVQKFEHHLSTLTEIARVRSVKDEDLERLLRESNIRLQDFKTSSDIKIATATAIMGASNTELKAMTVSARTALLLTQSTIDYISSLLMEFHSRYSLHNITEMQELLAAFDYRFFDTLVQPPAECPTSHDTTSLPQIGDHFAA